MAIFISVSLEGTSQISPKMTFSILQVSSLASIAAAKEVMVGQSSVSQTIYFRFSSSWYRILLHRNAYDLKHTCFLVSFAAIGFLPLNFSLLAFSFLCTRLQLTFSTSNSCYVYNFFCFCIWASITMSIPSAES